MYIYGKVNSLGFQCDSGIKLPRHGSAYIYENAPEIPQTYSLHLPGRINRHVCPISASFVPANLSKHLRIIVLASAKEYVVPYPCPKVNPAPLDVLLCVRVIHKDSSSYGWQASRP